MPIGYGDPKVYIDTLERNLAWAESELKAREHAQIHEDARQRQLRDECNARERETERKRLAAEEADGIRRGAWLMYLSGPEKLQALTEAGFSPVWIQNNTPNDINSWPPGDCLEQHLAELRYGSADALLPSDDAALTLVLAARKKGAPI